ncbi:MAG: sulfatase-like hydrolase/transferase [Gammaproteobacteria bacterium]|nr:sulfatase-like hydrolase/transferase [Gammaproteobacteria bacterium]
MLKQQDLLKGLIWVTLLAIFDQLLFFVSFQLASGGTVKVALGEGILWKVLLYPVVLKAISFFFIAQSIVYAVLIFVVWFCCQQLRLVYPWFEKRLYWMGTLLWTATFVMFCLGNIIYFPNSFFSLWLTKRPEYITDIFPKLALVWAVLVVVLSAVWGGSVLRFLSHHRRHPYLLKTSLLILALLLMRVGFAFYQQRTVTPVSSDTPPNIIIIGLDALRPDYTAVTGTSQAASTPHLNQFLQQAVIFDEAVTPLARTFPAWVSILTGRHPKDHGARFNLDAPGFLNIGFTLPKALQEKGYQTWFATDETRFSNIEADLGFDHLIKPPEGANDFLLGTLNDFPMTNLLVNSWIGEKIFPYSYANRAAFVTYRPATFVTRLNKMLPDQAHLKKPLFLSMHLLLSHWPNEWATSRFSSSALLPERYRASVQEVDAQWGAVMAMLKKKKLLDHAIVVVLSDHGESLGLPGDRLLTEKWHQPGKDSLKRVERSRYVTASPSSLHFKTDYGIDTSYGHGTDILSMSQYKTVLAWQYLGEKDWTPKHIYSRVSLLDIMPTLLDVLSVPMPKQVELAGVSLAKNLTQGNTVPEKRDFYLEDGYKIPAIATDTISIHQVLEQSLHAYNIDSKTGKVTMRSDIEQLGLSAKEYAIIQDHWMLAFYPPYTDDDVIKMLDKTLNKNPTRKPLPKEKGRWFMVDLSTQKWSADLESVWAKRTPAQQLKAKLLAFYGNEIHDL